MNSYGNSFILYYDLFLGHFDVLIAWTFLVEAPAWHQLGARGRSVQACYCCPFLSSFHVFYVIIVCVVSSPVGYLPCWREIYRQIESVTYKEFNNRWSKPWILRYLCLSMLLWVICDWGPRFGFKMYWIINLWMLRCHDQLLIHNIFVNIVTFSVYFPFVKLVKLLWSPVLPRYIASFWSAVFLAL